MSHEPEFNWVLISIFIFIFIFNLNFIFFLHLWNPMIKLILNIFALPEEIFETFSYFYNFISIINIISSFYQDFYLIYYSIEFKISSNLCTNDLTNSIDPILFYPHFRSCVLLLQWIDCSINRKIIILYRCNHDLYYFKALLWNP